MENCYSNDNDREEDKMLLKPLLHYHQISHARSKTMPKLFRSFNYWLKVPEEKLSKILNIIEPMYNGFVMVDDIYDDSVTRSGVPVMHSIYGVAHTVNSLNYTMANTLEKFLDLEEPRIIESYIKYSLEMHGGNGMEIYWRDNFICPTEKEYLDVICPKTSSAILFGVKVMQLFSNYTENLDTLVILLGQICQIQNDFSSLQLNKQVKVKTFCEDIGEGKFSFPIIHAIQSHPDDNEIMDILKQRTTNNDLKKYCVSLLEKYGSFAYTLQTMDRLKNEIFREVRRLGGNPYFEEVMKHVLDIIGVEG